jgi:hypothetical protein
MLESFDAKATARALQTGHWQGARAVKSPRTWEVARTGAPTMVGEEWCTALLQALQISDHTDPMELQVQNAAAAGWAGSEMQLRLWYPGPGPIEPAYTMSDGYNANCNPLSTMGMHGGEWHMRDTAERL